MEFVNKKITSDNFEQSKVFFLRGLENYQKELYEEAEHYFFLSLNLMPDRLSTLTNLSTVLIKLKKVEKANEIIAKGINLYPTNEIFYLNQGLLFNLNKEWQKSLVSFNKAFELKSDYVDAYYNHGIALQELKRLEEAVSSYDQAINLKPDYADAYYNRGVALQGLKRLEEAVSSYDQVINLKPDYAYAYNNRGIILQELKCVEDALLSYDKAISIKPDFAEAHYNRGITLHGLKRLEEAIISYDEAIQIKPDYADAYNNHGNVLKELYRFEQAIISYDKAIIIKPDYANAYFNSGVVLQELNRYDAVISCYEQAISIKPDYKFVIGALLNVKMLTCNWGNFDNQKDLILSKIDSNKIAVTPFVLLGLADSPSTHRRCSEMYIKEKFPLNSNLGAIPKNIKKNKIRLGYYSADFHNHATAYLMINFFELHDKNQFEIYAFSFGFSEEGEMRSRIKNAFDEFIEISHLSDESVAKLSRDLEIDIAIDLKGFTKDSRTGVFSCRAAPIQVNYLGYPGTMGANYIDYIIGDKTLIPSNSQEFYSEKVIYLPNSYQVNDSKKIISDKQFSRAELEFPEDSFVFCCFNNNYKILPSTFDSWMRILKAVEGSILWLLQDNEFAYENLKKEAQERGIEASRLVFAKRLPLEEHLARHRQADLFLDTFPYNAHTTASDALWAGLPLLTMKGESFASRVAASLLTAIDLPELITSSQEHYETLAIELATNPAKLKAIKVKLESNRLTTPLFDTPRFTKNLEHAYTKMYERYHAGLPPDNIYIED